MFLVKKKPEMTINSSLSATFMGELNKGPKPNLKNLMTKSLVATILK
jgi:hypothetical protein